MMTGFGMSNRWPANAWGENELSCNESLSYQTSREIRVTASTLYDRRQIIKLEIAD